MVDPKAVEPRRQAELREAIELFFFAYREFTAGPDRILGQRGLSRVHHRVLYFVGRNPGITINELLAILGVTKQALNAPLRQLVEMSLIAAREGAHDRRYRELALTADGARLEARLTGTQMKQLGALFAAAGRGAEESWKAVMRTMTEGKRPPPR
jgi:DNA-binding MarR family transcriptional regulator